MHGSDGKFENRSEKNQSVCCKCKSGKRDESECERGACWRISTERSMIVMGSWDCKRGDEDARV